MGNINENNNDSEKKKKWFKKIKDEKLKIIFYIPFTLYECENIDLNLIIEEKDFNELIFCEEINKISDKVFRMNRFNIYQNNFEIFSSFDNIELFSYDSLFDNWKNSENDFLKRFIYHIRLMDNFFIEKCNGYFLNEKNNFSFEDLKDILIKEFKNNEFLNPYISNYLNLMNEDNIFEILTQMISEEGELYNIIINREKNNLVIFTLLFFFIIDSISNLSILSEKNLYAYLFDLNNIFENEIFTPGNLITNKNFMSVSKKKKFFKNKNHVEIILDKDLEENKFFYLNSKIIDISLLSLYKQEEEIFIEPNSIFEVLSLEKKEDKTFKLKLKLIIDFKSKYSFNNTINEKIRKKFGENFIFFSGISYYNIKNTIVEIKQVKNIISLDLSNCGLNDNELLDLIPFICNFTFLKRLDLSQNNLTDVSIENLTNIFSFIQYLNSLILNQNNFSDSGIIILSEKIHLLKYLINISLENNHIKNEGIKSLSKNIFQMKKIKKLNLSINLISSEINLFCYYISKINNLSYLNLSKNNIQDEYILYLTEKFQFLPKLIYLNLSENYIKTEGMKSIFNNIKYLKELRYLILYGNKIGIEGSNSLKENIKFIPNLKELNLGFNIITDEIFNIIIENINSINNIEIINFRENAISSNGIINFVKLSDKCFNFKEINFSWNKINEDCFESLCEFIKKNKFLRRINLNNNSIKNIDCLKFLVNIQNINIKWNLNNNINQSEDAEFIFDIDKDRNIINKYFN